MAFHTEVLAAKPIVIQTLHEEYSGADTPALLAEVSQVLDRLSNPVYYILDLQHINLSFGDITLSANLATRGGTPAFHHPNVIETVVVTRNAALRMAALGLKHPVFGSARMTVVDTFEDAMTYCDTHLASQ